MFAVISIQSIFSSIVAFAAVHWVLKSLYNLHFHPLKDFPGSKIAAIGCEYEFYYDVLRDGQYLWRMLEMHKKYGQLFGSI